MINATIVGNLGRDAELKETQAGPVCSFSVASTTKRRGEESTTWVRCSLWGKRGTALCGYLEKGKQVAVAGELTTREYEGKTYVECNVSDLKLLGKREGAARPATTQTRAPLEDDDIPF